MQKTDNTTFVNARRHVQASTTLSRRYIERPKLKVSRPVTQNYKQDNCLKIDSTKNSQEQVEDRSATIEESKEQTMKKALALASEIEPNTKNNKFKKSRNHFSFGRIVLASICAAVVVFAIVYCVNLNMPDMSLKVTAMQIGIDAKYPNYIPRDFSNTDIVSESGKIVLNFKNSKTDTTFSITEEGSSWDSNALLNNFIKEEYNNNYTSIKEQGLTIYINNNNTGAAWVNGGIIYKIKVSSGSLTRKILATIATSGWK